MNYIIDIIIAAMAVIICVYSIKRGFVLSALEFAFSFVGTVISWFAAGQLCEPIYNGFIRERVLGYIDSAIVGSASVTPEIPESVIALGNKLGIFGENVSLDFSELITADKIESALLGPIAVFAVKCVSFILCSVILGILLKFAARAISKIVNRSPLKGVNSLLGGIFGLLKSGLIAVIAATAFVFISYLMPDSGFATAVASSKICGLAVEILNML